MSTETSVRQIVPDPLASNAPTWQKGISLSPVTPRIRQSIANVFRNAAQYAPTEEERLFCAGLAEKWEREATS